MEFFGYMLVLGVLAIGMVLLAILVTGALIIVPIHWIYEAVTGESLIDKIEDKIDGIIFPEEG